MVGPTFRLGLALTYVWGQRWRDLVRVRGVARRIRCVKVFGGAAPLRGMDSLGAPSGRSVGASSRTGWVHSSGVWGERRCPGHRACPAARGCQGRRGRAARSGRGGQSSRGSGRALGWTLAVTWRTLCVWRCLQNWLAPAAWRIAGRSSARLTITSWLGCVPATMLLSRRSTIGTPAGCSRSARICSEAVRRPRTRCS